jgi:hypothetical protein
MLHSNAYKHTYAYIHTCIHTCTYTYIHYTYTILYPSGFGAFNGPEGLRGFMRQKSVVTDRMPVRNAMPGFLQYPQADNSHLIVREAVNMVYGRSWTSSVFAFLRMMKMIVTGGGADKNKEKTQ